MAGRCSFSVPNILESVNIAGLSEATELLPLTAQYKAYVKMAPFDLLFTDTTCFVSLGIYIGMHVVSTIISLKYQNCTVLVLA